METRTGILPVVLICLAACGDAPANQAAAKHDVADDTTSPIAPAIIAPEEVAPASEPPSYEVAIASAAADHNKALDRCKTQPEAVRIQCEQEANAAFAESRDQLQDLRGNQQ